ncbi:TonB-dependent receptor [Pseudocolwellia sp. HL-MZ7]|uniref:TonB-dependent receptor n=1 Tax=Pseudocolwellia sp. HL-MZ7 TaxID=3400627 RepID=UPI003CF30F04
MNKKQQHVKRRYSNKKITFAHSIIAATILSVVNNTYAAEQEKDAEQVEVIEVTGIRGSLIKAQDIKREADTFVDAISSQDIGSLPDRSVLEAMSRIPGVSLERFASANDPDHFGIEGSGAVIRGMTQTRSEFNGRDTFSANSNRGLSFQDVSPELVGSVKVYKNQSADMIEGGIGGTVNLNTKLPFDSEGQVFAISVDATYTDLAKEYSPSISALYSNKWRTDSGTYGFLVNAANSELTSRSDGIQSQIILPRTDLYEDQGDTILYSPNGAGLSRQLQERERQGYALAGQWESLDETMVATVQFLRSDSSLSWNENTIKYSTNIWDDDGVTIQDESFPLDGFPEYEFDDNGVFQSGYITNVEQGGWRSNGLDQTRVPTAASWGSNPIPQFGHRFETNTRIKEQQSVVDDLSFNFKFRPNHSWAHELDIQTVNAKTDDLDLTLNLGTFANQFLDLTGDAPEVSFLNPWNGQNGFGAEDNENFLQSKDTYYWRSAMDHVERSEGDEVAVKWDSKYTFDRGFFVSVKAGVRYAKRDQTVRYSAFNFDELGALYSPDNDGNGYQAAWLDLPEHESLANDVDNIYWNNHFGGGNVSIPGDGYTLHPATELVRDYANWASRLSDVATDWVPLSEREPTQLGVDAQGEPIFEAFDGYFRPSEITEFSEVNKAFYVRLDFESDNDFLPFVGNFGARYVHLERNTSGFISFPDHRPVYLDNGELDPESARNLLPDDDKSFGNFAAQEISARSTNDYILPSFNIKFELGDGLISRFAAAKAIAYPNTGDMKAYKRIKSEVQGIQEAVPADPENPKLVDAVAIYNGDSGNPDLKPMLSTQFDWSLEWYYASDSSFTTTLFYKELKDFWVSGGFTQDIENPTTGITKTVELATPLNSDSGRMKGAEIALQHFFHGLPAPFNGLGIQTNYTYVDASSVPNSNLFTTSPDGSPATGSRQLAFDELPLAGQSKHTANMILMYQGDKIEGRIAYNWRSEYMITARDVTAPNRPVFSEASGFLDASIFYNYSDSIRVGIQGVNLLDTVTKTSIQIDEEGTRSGRSWFVNDRRVSLILRATF